MHISRYASAALVLVGTSISASAAVVVHHESFITTPVATNDFEAIGTQVWPVNTPYSQGGITVSYVTTVGEFLGDFVYTSLPVAGFVGSHSWVNIDNHGYTSIKLIDGNSFDQVQFLASSGRDGLLHYQLVYQGGVVTSGVAAGLPRNGVSPAAYSGFSGELFDEIRIKSSDSRFTDFNRDANDSLYIDDVAIGRAAVAAVPEPAAWMLMLIGFGATGAMLRQRTHPRRAVTA